jgi:hypothetical protein
VRIIAQGQFDVNQENINGLALSSIFSADSLLVRAGPLCLFGLFGLSGLSG